MYLYILESQKDKTHYVGIAHDVGARINYHNAGRVKSTKNKVPWIVVYTESHKNVQEARNREKYFKSYKGVREKRQIINNLR